MKDSLHTSKIAFTERYVKIDVCRKCQGRGRVVVFVDRGKDDEYDRELCPVCCGTGMVQKELTVSISSYDNQREPC